MQLKSNSFLYFLGSAAVGAVLTLTYLQFSGNKAISGVIPVSLPQIGGSTSENQGAAQNAAPYCEYSFQRLNGYKFIKPLIDGAPECESGKLMSLKSQISAYIDEQKRLYNLSYASVFLKNMATNDWMVINPSQGYHPGSLIKVAVMLAYLRMAESNPNLLNAQVDYFKDNTLYPSVEFKSDSIILGNRYKVKDLLYFMIAHSDNRATVVLENYMDMHVFKKAFSDLGLPELSFSDTSYRISARTYSNFFSSIYNAGYVSISSSEYAASLLTQSTFGDGLVKLLPPEVKVAHKFGEWGNGYQRELHETGIVYVENNPYLVTIMTNGNDWNKLSNAIAEISKMIYSHMAAKKGMAMAMHGSHLPTGEKFTR